MAIALGIEHGGWCPRGRLSEDGTIPSRYQLTEMDSADYPVRTEQNVIDSDATLILYEGKLKGGTLLTRRICKRLNKPFLCLRIDHKLPADVRSWLLKTRPGTLNIAGPRESYVGWHLRAFAGILVGGVGAGRGLVANGPSFSAATLQRAVGS